MNRTLNLKKFIHHNFFSFLDIFMRGATLLPRGRKISSPPGEFISHLAEIESPGGRKYFRRGEILYGGDFISGHRQF